MAQGLVCSADGMSWPAQPCVLRRLGAPLPASCRFGAECRSGSGGFVQSLAVAAARCRPIVTFQAGSWLFLILGARCSPGVA